MKGQGLGVIDPAQKICIVRSHPSDKNKGVARVGHPILCSYFRAGSIGKQLGVPSRIQNYFNKSEVVLAY
jgi:hypothetical protein